MENICRHETVCCKQSEELVDFSKEFVHLEYGRLSVHMTYATSFFSLIQILIVITWNVESAEIIRRQTEKKSSKHLDSTIHYPLSEYKVYKLQNEHMVNETTKKTFSEYFLIINREVNLFLNKKQNKLKRTTLQLFRLVFNRVAGFTH